MEQNLVPIVVRELKAQRAQDELLARHNVVLVGVVLCIERGEISARVEKAKSRRDYFTQTPWILCHLGCQKEARARQSLVRVLFVYQEPRVLVLVL